MTSPLDHVLSKLHGVKRSGSGWTALCPAHDDHRQSLGVDVGDDGRILLKCYAGCETSDILQALGLDWPDLFADDPRRAGNGSRRLGRIVKTYDYHDADGRLVLQVVRFDPKDFRQRRPDGAGGWIWNLNGVERVLYRLPELLAADLTQFVFLVEGEKDADRLIEAGLVATTNPQGAGKWRDSYSETLRGRRVVILPDNDDAGLNHARSVAASLHGVAASVRVLQLPDLAEKEDVSNWLDAGGTAYELLSLANEAEKWEPESDTEPRAPLLQEGADDEGNAQCVYALYGDRFAFCDAYGWLYYTGKFWDRQDAEARLERAIVETLKQRRTAAVMAERENIVKAAKPSAYRVRAAKFLFRSLVTIRVSEFDSSPDLLNCQNGVLDLRTGKLEPHEPAQRFTYCIPVEYDPKADWSEWERFLLQVTDHSTDVVEWMQQAVGYSLTGHTREEILFYIHGPTRSGKGTFTETILALLGRPLSAEADFNTFTARRDSDSQNFDLAPLKPARFITASESNKYQSLNAGKVKLLTGGNEIRCAFKHKDHFQYRPQYKIWLTSNFPVNADVDDDAVWIRLRVIEFPNSWAGREDKTLKQRMKSKRNLRGVLAWAVEGARKWYASEHGLETPEDVTLSTQRTRDELDYVKMFIDECCESDPGNMELFVSNSSLYAAYEQWCDENGITPKKKRSLTMSLKKRGFENGREYVDGAQKRGVYGLSLNAV